MLKKVIFRVLIGLWVINLLILVLLLFSRLEITQYWITYLQLIYLYAGISIKLGLIKKFQYSKITGVLFFVIFSFLTFYYAVFLDMRGPWKTQTVYYQNKHLSNRTIEFQLQDIGSFGYNRRRVDKIKILNGLNWIKVISNEEIDTLTWEKVDTYLNEMELKGG